MSKEREDSYLKYMLKLLLKFEKSETIITELEKLAVIKKEFEKVLRNLINKKSKATFKSAWINEKIQNTVRNIFQNEFNGSMAKNINRKCVHQFLFYSSYVSYLGVYRNELSIIRWSLDLENSYKPSFDERKIQMASNMGNY